MAPTTGLMRATTQFLSSPKRTKPTSSLTAVADEVELAKTDTSILTQTSVLETVDFYRRNDIRIGKLLKAGQFFDWYKIKSLPGLQQQDGSSHNGSDVDDSNGENRSCDDNSNKKHSLYVIKVFSQKFANSKSPSKQALLQQAAVRLVLEAKYLSRLDHPNIVQAKALPFGEETVLHRGGPDDIFLLTPRMVESLEDRLARWRQYQGDRRDEVQTFDAASQTFRTKLGYVKSLAQALAYLHKRGLMLLNLSPHTIGFLEDGTLQITDLSCCQQQAVVTKAKKEEESDSEEKTERRPKTSRALPRKTKSMDIAAKDPIAQFAVPDGGVPRYVAPEVTLHSKHTTKADTYSWAMVLFELMTLSQPYASYKSGQHLMKVCMQGQRPGLSVYHLPKELESLLCHTWCQDPLERLSMAKVVKAIPSPKRRAISVAPRQA